MIFGVIAGYFQLFVYVHVLIFVQMRWSFTTLFLFVFFLIPLDCFQRLFIGSQPLIRAKVQHTKEHRMLLFIVLV